MNLKNLTDDQLILSTKTAADVETKATTNVVRHFMEIYLRGLHLVRGHCSIWEMAKIEFKYDNASITRRTNAMELALAVPSVLEKIDKGELGLQTAADIQSFLNKERGRKKPYSREQKEELVNQCSGLSCLEVQIELANRNPDMKLKESKRFVSKEHVKVTYTTKVTTEEKVERVKSLLSHVNPYMTRDELTDFMAEKTLDAIDPVRKDLRHEMREEKKRAKAKAAHAKSKSSPNAEAVAYEGSASDLKKDSVSNFKSQFMEEAETDNKESGPLQHFVCSLSEKDSFEDLLNGQSDTASVPMALRDEVVGEFGEIQLAVDFFAAAETPLESRTVIEVLSEPILAVEATINSGKTSKEVLNLAAGSVQNLKAKQSRTILAKDKRAARMANQNRGCDFIDPVTGRRCASKHQLQFDHVVEYSKGGSNEAANLQVYCAQHNRFRWQQRSGSQVRCPQLAYG